MEAFAKQNDYTFPLLSDFNKNTIKDYDVYLENFGFGMKGVSKRAVFLINPEGNIVYKEITNSPGDTPNFENLQQAINNL